MDWSFVTDRKIKLKIHNRKRQMHLLDRNLTVRSLKHRVQKLPLMDGCDNAGKVADKFDSERTWESWNQQIKW